MFKLVADVPAHNAYCNIGESHYVASASRDGKVKVWKMGKGLQVEEIFQHTEHASFVNSIAMTFHFSNQNYLFIASGGTDGVIYIYNVFEKELAGTLIGHTSNVCYLEFQGRERLFSCSWDKTFRLWNGILLESTLEGHDEAVWGACVVSEGLFLTASADKSIRLWENGRCVKVYTGHKDVVRSVTMLDESLASLGDFVSVGNDGLLKFWYLGGNSFPTSSIQAHESFIYCVKVHKGHIFTAGEDSLVKVWRLEENSLKCIQSIPIPAISIWTLCITNYGDLICGASDGRIYIFTPHIDVTPECEMLENFQERLKSTSISKEILPNQIPTFGKQALLTKSGTHAGQTVLVKTKDETEVYQWNGSNWEKIGNMIEGPTAPINKKTNFRGVDYDFVFDVELESSTSNGGGPPSLKLPYNKGDNPYSAAMNFLTENNLDPDLLNQVVDFILKSTQPKVIQSLGEAELFDPYSLPKVQPTSAPHSFPIRGASPSSSSSCPLPPPPPPPPPIITLYKEVNIEGIKKKLVEFNLLEEGSEKISEESLNELVQVLSMECKPTNTLMAELEGTLRVWRAEHLFPIFDSLRVIAVQHGELLDPIIPQILARIKNLSGSTSSVLTAIRLLSNALCHPTCSPKIIESMDVCMKLLQDAYNVGLKDYNVPATMILGLAKAAANDSKRLRSFFLLAQPIILMRLRSVTTEDKELLTILNTLNLVATSLDPRQKQCILSELELACQKGPSLEALWLVEKIKKTIMAK